MVDVTEITGFSEKMFLMIILTRNGFSIEV